MLGPGSELSSMYINRTEEMAALHMIRVQNEVQTVTSPTKILMTATDLNSQQEIVHAGYSSYR